MDAVEYLKTWARICRKYGDCANCILSDFCNHSCYEYDNYQFAEQAIANVLEWVKEYPVKTRQSEFLKMFPNASVGYNGTLVICPSQADTKAVAECVRSERNCDKCKREFWLKEIE